MRKPTVFVLAAPLVSAAGHALPAGGDNDSYVRVSPRDARYLGLTDGSPYIPIGLNMISPPEAASEEEAFRGLEAWLDSLAAKGGTYIRIWVSNPFWSVEHEKSSVYDGERAQRGRDRSGTGTLTLRPTISGTTSGALRKWCAELIPLPRASSPV
jgi:hypothetical protein